MHRSWLPSSSTASSSSSSTTSSKQSSKRKWTRQQLLANLSILGSLADPLPPTLPPSPPASRSSSPAPGSKRKADPAADHDHAKRYKPGASSEIISNHHIPHSNHPTQGHHRSASSISAHGKRTEIQEDGELYEDASAPQNPSTSDASLNNVPIRRPKMGVPPPRHYEELHDKYHGVGRKLKYSGDARFWSTYPPTHKEYRPLANPPPPNSLYHKFGGLIARLELLEALLAFNYALWIKDYKTRTCHRETWKTGEGFLKWCKAKWSTAKIQSEAEKALIGLIWMLESFIFSRQAFYLSYRQLVHQLDDVVGQTNRAVAEAIAAAEQKQGTEPNSTLLGVKAESSTPQMLPSPASLAPSANSTPTGRAGSTPSTGSSSERNPPPPIVNAGPPIPLALLPPQFQSGLPVPPYITATANTVTASFSPQLTGAVHDLANYVKTSGNAAKASQDTLTLPIMARCFPRTFARMVHSTLSPNEEHEPDMEDDDGELLWPGQCVNGEGIGWVCLMGQAMIREFGKPYGYKGLAGIVPKPEVIDDVGSPFGQASGLPSRPRTHGATPGHTPPAFIQRSS